MSPAPRSRRLEERSQDFLSEVTQLEKALQQPEDEFVRDAIIQRFEFTYEMAWKTLQLRLEAEGIQTQTPRQALQEGLAAGWIHDGSVWSEIQRNRNLIPFLNHYSSVRLTDRILQGEPILSRVLRRNKLVPI